jgi:hypothetical protein
MIKYEMTLLNNHTNIHMLNIKTPIFFPTSVFIFIRIFSPFLFLYHIPFLSFHTFFWYLACLFGLSLLLGLSLSSILDIPWFLVFLSSAILARPSLATSTRSV